MHDEETPPPSGAAAGERDLSDLRLTATQRQILEALCRPRASGNRYAPPATNQEIASTVYLSVDAVKAHLRVLYRKFGVEPLPHNQKRARLVELVFEGGLLDAPPAEEAPAADEAPKTLPAEADRDLPGPGPVPPQGKEPPSADEPGRRRKLSLRAVAAIGAGAAVAATAAILLLSGSPDEGAGEEATSLGEYREAMNSFCGLAFPFREPPGSAPVGERANGYLSAIATVASGLDSISPPAVESPALQQFSSGLSTATALNRQVALDPPRGSEAQSIFANLTIASGKVQAGSIDLRLGEDCKALAGIIARSAENVGRSG